jgi:hypothetical protein
MKNDKFSGGRIKAKRLAKRVLAAKDARLSGFAPPPSLSRARCGFPMAWSAMQPASRLANPAQEPAMSLDLNGVKVPDSALAKAITEMVRDNATPLLFHHSSRVYYWGALTGARKELKFDAELLYAGAMFHDMGLMPRYCSQCERFEVDGADCAAQFLRSHGIAESDIDTVWTAIALHTTPGIPQHMKPEIALVTAGVEMDVLGIAYPQFPDAQRDAVVAAHPRGEQFKQDILQAFYDGIKGKPETTFGNVKADVLAMKDADFVRGNFCEVILNSDWAS